MQSSIVSEFSLIQKIRQKVATSSKNIIKGIGDDCAVIKMAKNKYLLATCDAQVEGVHFLPKITKPQQIGQNAISVNVSDIASMGGKPLSCLISLIIPKNTSLEYIDDLYSGIIGECKKYKIEIIGGNISKGKELIIDVFMMGEVTPKELILRSNAKPGDKMLVTGSLGEAAAGLELLLLSDSKTQHRNQFSPLITRYLIPKPRLKESRIIAKTKAATSMIDISDGLGSDACHLCEESGVGIKLYENLLPISRSLLSVAKILNKSPLDLALNGGGDYELCFTVPPDFADKVIKTMKQKAGTKVSVIGEVLPKKEGSWLILKNGRKVPLKASGWDHFKNGK